MCCRNKNAMVGAVQVLHGTRIYGAHICMISFVGAGQVFICEQDR